jgi:hypothetical protein
LDNFAASDWPATHKFATSAIPPKADIETQRRNVRFVPKADIVLPPLL